MASTFSSALNLELQASGENSGTWGVITNNNLQKVESAIKGYVSIAIASTSDSLDTSDGSTTDEQSNAIIKLTGTLTGNTTMQSEAVETWYIVDNATTMGTHSLSFKPAGGSGTDLVAGSKHILYTDGSTMFDVLKDCGDISANGTLIAYLERPASENNPQRWSQFPQYCLACNDDEDQAPSFTYFSYGEGIVRISMQSKTDVRPMTEVLKGKKIKITIIN